MPQNTPLVKGEDQFLGRSVCRSGKRSTRPVASGDGVTDGGVFFALSQGRPARKNTATSRPRGNQDGVCS